MAAVGDRLLQEPSKGGPGDFSRLGVALQGSTGKPGTCRHVPGSVWFGAAPPRLRCVTWLRYKSLPLIIKDDQL